MVRGQRGDGGNGADDESLRKIKTNKQRQLSYQMDLKQKSAERVDVLSQSPSVMMWKLQLRGRKVAECPFNWGFHM